MTAYPVPRELTKEEIQGIVKDYADAAHNAVEAGVACPLSRAAHQRSLNRHSLWKYTCMTALQHVRIGQHVPFMHPDNRRVADGLCCSSCGESGILAIALCAPVHEL